ncbi:MAG: hypothetical protein MUE46_12485 [Xanthomonadales bacterium]|jgi:septal ring factor EnvC (AmiA/AmiB activator)|nr:hypothetical protein [Xanthomonadales bacterium]
MASRPQYVLRREAHRPRWQLPVLIAILWTGSLLGLYAYLKQTLVPGFAQLETSLRETRLELARAQTQIDELRLTATRFERAEQIAQEANASLTRQLNDRQDEVAQLRADLSFFQRLLEDNADQRGVAIYSIRLRAAPAPRTYRYVVTLSQNLQMGQVTRGNLRMIVRGVQNGQRRRLSLKELGTSDAVGSVPYEFKYFQQLDGSLVLPEGFVPDAVELKLESREGQQRAAREIAWETALEA